MEYSNIIVGAILTGGIGYVYWMMRDARNHTQKHIDELEKKNIEQDVKLKELEIKQAQSVNYGKHCMLWAQPGTASGQSLVDKINAKPCTCNKNKND